MPDLVSLADLQTFLELSGGTDDDLLTDLLDHAEGLFESETGRKDAPFVTSGNARSEVKDGTGSAELYLDYPISDVTSISIGFDSSDFEDTLDPDDPDIVVWGAGSRKIERVDGGIFGRLGKPRYLTIVYDFQADLPEEAQMAIKRVVGQIYRQRGSEGATREQIGSYIRTMAKQVKDDPLWRRAVAGNTRRVLV
jgi:hypothetical protein